MWCAIFKLWFRNVKSEYLRRSQPRHVHELDTLKQFDMRAYCLQDITECNKSCSCGMKEGIFGDVIVSLTSLNEMSLSEFQRKCSAWLYSDTASGKLCQFNDHYLNSHFNDRVRLWLETFHSFHPFFLSLRKLSRQLSVLRECLI